MSVTAVTPVEVLEAPPSEAAPVDKFVEGPAPIRAVSDGRALPKAVRIPLGNYAGYPFANEQFDIRVQETDGSWTEYPGKVTGVYYGFTPATRAEYEADNNVPWFNDEGQAVAEGLLLPNIHHDGDYKGTYLMDALVVDVPPGLNLVFKVAFDKFGGSPYQDGDTFFIGSAETKTYFVDVTGA